MSLKKILVVEDQEDIRELIHFNLFKHGYEISLACDGKEALAKVKSESPDLIILDLMLPIIKNIIKNKEEKETFRLWNIIKEDEEIEKLLRKLIEKIDMPVVIYVASKFKNNKYFGTRIIEGAQKSEDF